MTTTTKLEPLEERIEAYLSSNFPFIWLHGGDAGVTDIDEETGEVWITLAGACAGCGISPMTVQALEHRLLTAFEELRTIHVSADGPGDTVSSPSF